MQTSSRTARLGLLIAVGATLVMIALRIGTYQVLLERPGAKTVLTETVALLLLYGFFIAWTQQPGTRTLRPQFALLLGAAGGVLEVGHLLLERFAALPTPWEGRITLAFEAAVFLLWGYAAWSGRRRGLSLAESVASAVWSAVVTMTLAVAFGVLLEFFLAPWPLAGVAEWAEFKRSGWTDLQAFAIANTLEAASTHLLAGPLVAAVFGLCGFGAAGLLPPNAPQHESPAA